MSSLHQPKTLKEQMSINSITSHKPSSQFASNSQRFTYKIQKSPGPGSYQYKTSNFKIPEYHVNKDKDSPIKKQHRWIFGSDRISFIENKNISMAGPGSYYDSGRMHEAVIGRTNWGKSQRFIYGKNKELSMSVPGPGAYQNKTTHPTCNASSAFRSKSPRSFLERIVSQNSIDLKKSKASQLVQNPEKSTIDYSQKSTIKTFEQKQPKKYKKVAQSSVFSSNIPRFQGDPKNSNVNLGPGSYQLPSLDKQRSRDKFPKIITVRNDDRVKKAPKHQESQAPGPGSYDFNEKNIEKSIQKIGNSMVRWEKRFIQKAQPIPGPGHYMKNKKTYAGQFQNSHKKISPEKPSFNTTSNRCPPQLANKENPLCSYNLGYFDIQNKIKKSQQHIQKLRIMEVTLPAFNSKAKR